MCFFNFLKQKEKDNYIYIKKYKLIKELRKLRREIMATKQEVLDAIASEKAQVLEAVESLNVQIQALKDQLAAGTPITDADLDEIVTAVNDIFIPPSV